MNALLITIGIVCALGILANLVLQLKRESKPMKQEDLSKDLARMEKDLEAERKEKNELAGKGKELYDRFKNLESEYKATTKERDRLQKTVGKFETTQEHREKEHYDMVNKLESAVKNAEKERERVIHEDEERLKEEEEERDRIWTEHERNVISGLTELCKQPQYMFTTYTNTNLPEDFDGSLKPDFMIQFLDQYLIFDAKKSKQESLQNYINSTIKKTVEKVKKNPKVASMIYLVVPTEAVSELKIHHFVHDGYTLFVVSPEALPPILACLKRITMYEFAETMDPQQRENIVQIIAELDFHVNLRNATDIIMSKMGAELLAKSQKVDPVLAEQVALKKQPMNMKAGIATGEIKKIVSSLAVQNLEIQKLVSPSTFVRRKDLEAAQQILEETLP